MKSAWMKLISSAKDPGYLFGDFVIFSLCVDTEEDKEAVDSAQREDLGTEMLWSYVSVVNDVNHDNWNN